MAKLTRLAGRLNITTVALVLGLSTVAGATTAPEPTEPPTTTAPTTSSSAPPTTAPVTTGPVETEPIETEPPATEPPSPTPTASVDIEATNTADGGPPAETGTAEPAEAFAFHFEIGCTSPLQDCVNLTFTHVFPSDLVVDEELLPDPMEGFRDVTFDETTNTLTIRYLAPLGNPAGAGLPAAGSDTFDVTVALRDDTTLPDGYELVDEFAVTADNVSAPAIDDTTVIVSIPPPEPSEPVTSEPVTSEPVTSEPVTSEPVTSEPTESTEPAIVPFDADPTGSISVEKTNTADGSPPADTGTAEPGDTFTFHFEVDCSSPLQDCVGYTFTDTFPPEVVVDPDSLPESIPGFREVEFDEETNTLTIRYVGTLDNPAGTGLPAGGGDTFDVTVTLPADTPLPDGYEIVNDSTVTASNVAEPATDETTVIVSIPRVVDVATDKTFTPGAVISTDPDAAPVISLNGTNNSSSTAEVNEMVFEDSTSDTWEYFDLTSVDITAWPDEAETATLRVCAAPGPCPPGVWTDVETITNPATSFTIDPAVAADAVGVQIAFESTDDEPIPTGATGGVDIGTDLRETVRSTGEDVATNPETVAFDNCASTTANDPGDPDATPPVPPLSDAAEGCAPVQILPPTVDIAVSKNFFPDENGNFQTDAGEHAVIGENSGVSMVINAVNESAFPINQVVITEPVDPNEFEKFDPTSIRLTIPEVTSNVNVVINYDSGAPTVIDCAPADCPNPIPVDSPPARKVTSVTVTYTGEDAEGDPTINPGSTAGLGLHGNLNDLVDESDVPGAGELAGIDNCANISSQTDVPGSTGSFTGDACDLLPVEERGASTGGEKTSSQDSVPPDQPILFTMRTTNNGNLPLFDVVVSDPPPDPVTGIPPLTDTFEFMTFLGADIQPAAMQSRVTVEVYYTDLGWQPFTPTSPPVPPQPGWENIIGVRATIDELLPTESFDLRIGLQLREGVDPADVPPISNCYSVTGDDSQGVPYVSDNFCNPPLPPQPVTQAAVLNKVITPQTMPRPIPGLVSAPATVQLSLRNDGTLTMHDLQATDNDADFWDAVDFVGFGTITPPAVGALRDANQLRVDAFVDGAWVLGSVGSPSSPSLPSGVTAADVDGLRFTFSDTSVLNEGFVITPCEDGAGCTALIPFQVRPRIYLKSSVDGSPPGEEPVPVPDQLLDTASGAFTTRLSPDPDDPEPIPPATDDLNFVPGDPQLDVEKGPENRTVTPGQLSTFTLTTLNNGTANLPDLVVSDPLPAGILFDDTFAGDGGAPYTVVWSNLPADYPAPPDPVFVSTPDPIQPDRVGFVSWTFPGWDMPPNAQVVITFRYTLEPGVRAGQRITNTMGASSPVDDLACTPPDVPVSGEDTPWGITGTFCTDPANVTVAAGANFVSRKWVAGNPELGWYNQSTGEVVPIGGGGCLSLEGPAGTYTTNPCIALVNPGEDFHYILRVQNGGTQPATRMVIVDTFPAPGDTSVLGTPRGTEWATAPTIAGPAVYTGPATGTLSYSTSQTPCTDDLFLEPPACPDGAWTGDTSAATRALQMSAVFDAADLLDPGEEVLVTFSMTSPADVPRVADPTIAWNSLAHAEEYQADDQGNTAILRPLEPLRVGVATMYGTLEVVKEIGENPAGLPLDDVEFEFTYECTLTNGTAWSGNGTVTATPTEPGTVTGIPAGSTCEVWESGTNGAIATPTEDDPAVVVIEPSLDPETGPVATVTGTNDFPLGELEILKTVTGFDNPDFTGGPYPAAVDCTFDGTEVPGFPVDVELTPGTTATVEAPVGSVCTVTETDDLGATTVTYDPPNADGTAAEVTVPPEAGATVSIGITNDFPFGAVSLLKEVTGGVDPAFTGGPYSAALDCQFDDVSVPGFPVVVELIPDVPSDAFVAPVGSVCTVTETDDRGATTVTFAPPSGSVTVTEGSDQTPISITITNDFPAGGLQVFKEIGENDADLELDDLEYTFAYQCTFDPGDGELITWPDEPGELVATANPDDDTNDTVDGIPAGATCEVWETDNNGGIPSATEDDPAVVVIEAGTIEQPYTPVTVTNDYPTGRAELVKLVAGDAQEEFTAGPFAVAVNCWGPDQEPGTGEPFPGFPVVVEVFPDEPVGTDLPVGTTCWFEELDIPEGVTVTYDPSNEDGTAGEAVVPSVPPDEGFFGTVSVTNTFATGSLVIEKEVSGPGAPAFSQGPFVFGVSCDYQGVDDVYSVAVVVPGSPDGTPVESEPVTGLPIGAECTVTEIDNGGADIVTPPQTVTIEENEEANVAFVGVNNPFSAGTISVAKVVDGTAADSDFVQGLTFTIDVECAVEGTDGTLSTIVDETVTVAPDGEAVPVTGDDGEPLLVPLGARCWGAEESTFGATMASIDHDSYETGAEVVADAEGGTQELLITATNIYDSAELTVSKEVVGDADPNAVYTFDVGCTVVDADGTVIDAPLLSGQSPVGLRAGESATFDVLAESTCTVTESDPPTGAVVTITESAVTPDDNPSDGTVIVDAETSVVVTNAFDDEVSPATTTPTTVALPRTA